MCERGDDEIKINIKAVLNLVSDSKMTLEERLFCMIRAHVKVDLLMASFGLTRCVLVCFFRDKMKRRAVYVPLPIGECSGPSDSVSAVSANSRA